MQNPKPIKIVTRCNRINDLLEFKAFNCLKVALYVLIDAFLEVQKYEFYENAYNLLTLTRVCALIQTGFCVTNFDMVQKDGIKFSGKEVIT